MIVKTKFVPKNWGYEQWLVNNDLYCGKILFVKRDKFCSWHYHKVKDETFHLLEGSVEVKYGRLYHDEYLVDLRMSSSIILKPGDSLHIPVGMPHRFYGLEDSKIIEISTHHEDSDSYRLIEGSKLEQ